MTIFCDGAFEGLQIYSSSVSAGFHSYYAHEGDFQGCCGTGGGERNLAVLPQCQSFFPFYLNKQCPDYCHPLVNFQTSEKVDFDNISSFIVVFKEK